MIRTEAIAESARRADMGVIEGGSEVAGHACRSEGFWMSNLSVDLSPTDTPWMLYLDETLMDTTGDTRVHEDFTVFVGEVEPKLSYALAAAYGVEVGREATADALAYAWENWPKLREMDNPAGYLYRVGQSAAKKHRRRPPLFPPVVVSEMPMVEPSLPAALGRLSRLQRTAVVLLYVLDWSEREAADFLGVDRSTVRRHRDRGLKKLRKALEVDSDG